MPVQKPNFQTSHKNHVKLLSLTLDEIRPNQNKRSITNPLFHNGKVLYEDKMRMYVCTGAPYLGLLLLLLLACHLRYSNLLIITTYKYTGNHL